MKFYDSQYILMPSNKKMRAISIFLNKKLSKIMTKDLYALQETTYLFQNHTNAKRLIESIDEIEVMIAEKSVKK